MRGGKYSEFEGGVRVNAFSSGGAVDPAARGSRSEGLMSVADVYSSFCHLAGVDPKDAFAESKGLPAVDGVDASPMLLGVGPSPRVEVPLAPLDMKSVDQLERYHAVEALWNTQPTLKAPVQCTKRNAYTYKDASNLTMVDGLQMNECCAVCTLHIYTHVSSLPTFLIYDLCGQIQQFVQADR